MKRFATLASIVLALFPAIASAQTRFPTVDSVLAPTQTSSSAAVRRELAAALDRGDSKAVTTHALTLAWMEATLSDASFARIAPLLDEKDIRRSFDPGISIGSKSQIEAMRHWFRLNAAPRVKGRFQSNRPFAEVPAEYRLVEGIAWDARRKRLFIGTVIEGRLAYRDEDDSWHEVPLGSPRGGLFGMAIDSKRRLLWIATGSVPQTAVPGESLAGLIAVNLDTLKVVRRVPLGPTLSGSPGDLTIAANGAIYVSDPMSGAVHRCRPGCTVIEAWLPARTWASPQGLALTDKDNSLYVADYSTGLWIVDTRTRSVRKSETLSPTMLEGIDGLLTDPDGNLIAIQNGTSPRRIIKLVRADAGLHNLRSKRYVDADTHVVFAPEAGEATLGTFWSGSTLVFVADSQWERYGARGTLKDGNPLRPTRIGSVNTHDSIEY